VPRAPDAIPLFGAQVSSRARLSSVVRSPSYQEKAKMIRKHNRQWSRYLCRASNELRRGRPLRFADMTPSKIPEKSGVYLISVKRGKSESPYYVGTTKNLRERLYRNHLMGSPAINARLKMYLIASKQCKNAKDAKSFIRRNCLARWFLEGNARKRGAVEGYVTGIVFPKYGIEEEH
jgi:predicted GIY-YIG superfamily endonuclease